MTAAKKSIPVCWPIVVYVPLLYVANAVSINMVFLFLYWPALGPWQWVNIPLLCLALPQAAFDISTPETAPPSSPVFIIHMLRVCSMSIKCLGPSHSVYPF